MNRWSLSRRFRKVSAQDFRDAVDNIRENMQELCGSEIDLEIKCYDGMKHSITKWDDDLQEWLNETNSRKVFASATSSSEMTDDMWLQAVFVEAVLHPVDKDKGKNDVCFGHVEAKGHRPKQMTFYLQPEEVGAPSRQSSFEQFKGWRKGDGYSNNHTVTYS